MPFLRQLELGETEGLPKSVAEVCEPWDFWDVPLMVTPGSEEALKTGKEKWKTDIGLSQIHVVLGKLLNFTLHLKLVVQ